MLYTLSQCSLWLSSWNRPYVQDLVEWVDSHPTTFLIPPDDALRGASFSPLADHPEQQIGFRRWLTRHILWDRWSRSDLQRGGSLTFLDGTVSEPSAFVAKNGWLSHLPIRHSDLQVGGHPVHILSRPLVDPHLYLSTLSSSPDPEKGLDVRQPASIPGKITQVWRQHRQVREGLPQDQDPSEAENELPYLLSTRFSTSNEGTWQWYSETES